MYLKIDHIGIAVRSLEAALKVYCQGFGLRTDHVEEVADDGLDAGEVLRSGQGCITPVADGRGGVYGSHR